MGGEGRFLANASELFGSLDVPSGSRGGPGGIVGRRPVSAVEERTSILSHDNRLRVRNVSPDARHGVAPGAPRDEVGDRNRNGNGSGATDPHREWPKGHRDSTGGAADPAAGAR